MSIGTIIILFIFLGILVRDKENLQEVQWKLFCVTLFVSTFINCGYAFKIGPVTITYSIWCQFIYIIIAILLTIKSSISIRKSILISDILIIISLVLGLTILQTSTVKPLVIPWTTRMDDVYYQISKAEYPKVGYGNYLNLIYFAVFFLFIAFSMHFLRNKKYIDRLKKAIKVFFKIFIISMLCEFFINNLISPSIIRNCVRTITGVASYGYDIPQMRFGLYGILQFFNESSYFCLFIILYILILVEGITKDFNEKWIGLSILALILSGATSAWIIIPIVILALLKNLAVKKRKSQIILAGIILMFLTAICAVVMSIKGEYIYLLINDMFNKISSYLSGIHNGFAVSGSIRHMGNEYAYQAFLKSPLFGWGIGTLRSYGILPGALGCFGCVGLFSMFFFISKHCNLKINKAKMIAFMILVIYSTSILSVGYLYDPAIILITFAFNTLVWRKKENVY